VTVQVPLITPLEEVQPDILALLNGPLIASNDGVPEVQLVAGDITQVDDARLSKSYSAILLDIDLADPTYTALKRFWPRLMQGGIIYVDDCPEGYNWKARIGYEKVCVEFELQPHYEYGLGVLYK
jgi:O-methyltransferase